MVTKKDYNFTLKNLFWNILFVDQEMKNYRFLCIRMFKTSVKNFPCPKTLK